ncbi:hypothetical protein K4L44_05640 [Halosquirtibacter laminarini]|uniref:Uncharacterized protein n=1 Tax=Halosquirtibacter laminarini TaxID=3374600 RepID=A0AC61NKP7_9BACT|nr:hypothetical protein K4L44_05640 [Prolixibacteraceae bacterium]
MKKAAFLLCLMMASFVLTAQKKEGWSLSGTFMNRYVWRGNDYGNGPVVQPSFSYSFKNFSIGAWGNYSLNISPNNAEVDLWSSYSFSKTFKMLLTDYYFPVEPGNQGNFMSCNAHTYELGAMKTFGRFQASFYGLLNGPNTMYGEVKYTKNKISLFIGGGGTTNNNLCIHNTGISYQDALEVSDRFQIPIQGSLIYNPSSEQIYLTFGFTIQ